jgi:hypothetical protein
MKIFTIFGDSVNQYFISSMVISFITFQIRRLLDIITMIILNPIEDRIVHWIDLASEY